MRPSESLALGPRSSRHARTMTVRSPALVAAIAALVTALLPQCFPVADERPLALVEPDRSGHLLDRPYPSDELRVCVFREPAGLAGFTRLLGAS